MVTYRLELPWVKPPLNLNQRHKHWANKAHLTAIVRSTVGWLAKQRHIPASRYCTVTLIWAPGDKRRRDADNLVGTLKPACDGIVDAGIVPDDTPEYMKKEMPIFRPGKPAGMWLEIKTEL